MGGGSTKIVNSQTYSCGTSILLKFLYSTHLEEAYIHQSKYSLIRKQKSLRIPTLTKDFFSSLLLRTCNIFSGRKNWPFLMAIFISHQDSTYLSVNLLFKWQFSSRGRYSLHISRET